MAENTAHSWEPGSRQQKGGAGLPRPVQGQPSAPFKGSPLPPRLVRLGFNTSIIAIDWGTHVYHKNSIYKIVSIMTFELRSK